MNTPPSSVAGRRRFWRQLLEFGSWLIDSEELPRVADETPKSPSARAAFSLLASSETLARREPRSDRSRHMLSWLVSRDPLPSLPATSHHGHEFFSWLSSREHLASKSTGVTTAPRSFLRWLLTLDPHERLENRQPAKEVTPHEA